MLASYLMYEGMYLTFRVGNDNLDLGWTTNGKCILQSLILDESERDNTGIGDVWQLNFKHIGLISRQLTSSYIITVRFAKIYQTIVRSLLQHMKQECSIYLCI